jgi:16S rRNA A1518/A1519 N6-dimethyltransferase RsmA/KsgA/DIM1 with predicted DNA glycosylase/AP lyase activity
LPARRILKIAPGFGRWTKFLLPACDKYVGVDLSEKCTEACQKILSDARHARFVTNDGQSLEAVEDHTIGLVFSFDSLVHAEYPILGRFV